MNFFFIPADADACDRRKEETTVSAFDYHFENGELDFPTDGERSDKSVSSL